MSQLDVSSGLLLPIVEFTSVTLHEIRSILRIHGSTMLKTPKVLKSLLLVVINEVIPAVKYVAPSSVSKIRLRPKR